MDGITYVSPYILFSLSGIAINTAIGVSKFISRIRILRDIALSVVIGVICLTLGYDLLTAFLLGYLVSSLMERVPEYFKYREKRK